eukprot:349810-Chlamydomonas_euryale.AAC.4
MLLLLLLLLLLLQIQPLLQPLVAIQPLVAVRLQVQWMLCLKAGLQLQPKLQCLDAVLKQAAMKRCNPTTTLLCSTAGEASARRALSRGRAAAWDAAVQQPAASSRSPLPSSQPRSLLGPRATGLKLALIQASSFQWSSAVAADAELSCLGCEARSVDPRVVAVAVGVVRRVRAWTITRAFAWLDGAQLHGGVCEAGSVQHRAQACTFCRNRCRGRSAVPPAHGHGWCWIEAEFYLRERLSEAPHPVQKGNHPGKCDHGGRSLHC